MVILCAASFFSAVGHFPIQVILTSTQCPATLGHASLTILYASLAISSQLSHITLRYLSPKVSLLCGIASHLVFNLANVYPSYETLIPASVISGVDLKTASICNGIRSTFNNRHDKLVSSTYGIHMVGLAMSCYGVARLPWSFLSCSRWRKITESQQFCVLGCTLLLACYVFTFSTALKQPSTPIIAYTVLFWGFTDGLSQQLIAGVCQKYSIKSHIGTRYTSFRALGLAVGLGAAPFLCPVYRLYALTLGILVYTVVCPCSQKLSTQKQTSSADV
ncbi:uncharacterized protein LOC135475682 [Liolophura sinensis]|uniref:uncharacterized protein LOC135475682 n=1 Tax=Liolophura sinensis TaxID=3198878 RepID=UPI0031581188